MGWAGSGGPSDVAMVEATDFANRDDPAEFRPLNPPAVGRVLVERKVSTRPVVVREVASQGTAQVSFAEDEDVIQTFAPDGADKPLREGILPRAVRSREDFLDPYAVPRQNRGRPLGCMTPPGSERWESIERGHDRLAGRD